MELAKETRMENRRIVKEECVSLSWKSKYKSVHKDLVLLASESWSLSEKTQCRLGGYISSP